MNPVDFIDFASKLASVPEGKESRYRTAVGRAYYGAFHVAKQFLEELSIALPKRKDAHTLVPIFLQHSGNSDAALAGSLLDSLKANRTDADYKLNLSPAQWTQRDAMLRVENAHDIVSSVEKCKSPNVREQIAAGVAQYREHLQNRL